jgi:AcrR family transcriptional regulator
VSATQPRKQAPKPRLAAPERRAALLDVACRVFSEGSYRGTTTAEIAREAGVTEPILYRHFQSKRDLYLACLAEAWRRVRSLWGEAVEREPDPARWHAAMVKAWRESESYAVIANLWVQALVEAAEDPAISDYMRGHMREVHDYIAGVLRRSQEAGGVLPERDPGAEAWISLAIGLLRMIDLRLGGLTEHEAPAIAASRRAWLTGLQDSR